MREMWKYRAWRGSVAMVVALIGTASTARAQGQAAGAHAQHDMKAEQGTGWRLAQDGVVFGLFNHQGGPRGGDEFVVPNWWMGVWTRQKGNQQFGLNAMLSLDPATVGKKGYREIFQVGEALGGKPLIDRQHPHDFFTQLAASWRRPLGEHSAFTIAGGPAGEPTLGPVAFMHRPSAAGLVLAPLGHHTFDSTHISFGVVTAAVERGAGSSKDRFSMAASLMSTGGTSISARSIRWLHASGSGRPNRGNYRSPVAGCASRRN